MLVVPRGDELLADAKVAPSDIDQVVTDGDVALRILSGNRRTTPMIGAKVSLVSPDFTQSSIDTPPYYRVRLRIEMEGIVGSVLQLLRPGVPVEAFYSNRAADCLGLSARPALRATCAHVP